MMRVASQANMAAAAPVPRKFREDDYFRFGASITGPATNLIRCAIRDSVAWLLTPE
jgi:hypothetical protein